MLNAMKNVYFRFIELWRCIICPLKRGMKLSIDIKIYTISLFHLCSAKFTHPPPLWALRVNYKQHSKIEVHPFLLYFIREKVVSSFVAKYLFQITQKAKPFLKSAVLSYKSGNKGLNLIISNKESKN
jgi:hypothetical protein